MQLPLTCEHGKGGGLPRTVVAQQDGDLPLVQVQVQVPDGHLVLIPHLEHLGLQRAALDFPWPLRLPLPLECSPMSQDTKVGTSSVPGKKSPTPLPRVLLAVSSLLGDPEAMAAWTAEQRTPWGAGQRHSPDCVLAEVT